MREQMGRAIILVDLENLFINLGWQREFTAEAVSKSFLELIRQISKIIQGEVIGVYVFAPPHLASMTDWEKAFYELKFPVICCPKIAGGENETDTVDEIMTREGSKLIKNMGLTHLCMATGDADFIPLYQEAKELGLRTITVYASEISLALGLIKVSDQCILFPFPPSGERAGE